MKIEPRAALPAVQNSRIFVYLALLVGAFSSLKVLLNKVKGFAVDDCFVSVGGISIHSPVRS